MGIRTQIDRLDVTSTKLADDLLAQVLVNVTKERLAQFQAKNASAVGSPVPYSIAINGRVSQGIGSIITGAVLAELQRAGRQMAQSKGSTQIVIAFSFLFTALQMARLLRSRGRSDEDDPLRWIARTLRERSPIMSGAYRDAHFLRADSVFVATAAEIARGFEVPDAQIYMFTNSVPYARRIEVGRTKAGRSFVLQVANRIYERTATDAAARFGNIAKIYPIYVELEDAPQVSGRMAHQPPRYLTGEMRKVTQTHWMPTTVGVLRHEDDTRPAGPNGLIPAGWVTYKAGGAKSRIRRGGGGTLQAPAVVVVFRGQGNLYSERMR